MKYLRQSTAATIAAGPFLQIANGYTPVTSLTTGSTLNGRIVSNGTGAAFTPATFTHDSNGHYLVALATGDIPSVGRLRVEFSDPATYLPVWEDFTVLSAAVYDVLFGTTALASTTNITAGTMTAVGTLTTYTGNTPQTGDSFARIGAAGAGLTALGSVTLAANGLDAITVETGVNARQALSPILAACSGVLSGAGTGTIVIKGGNVATTRITATTTSEGNRTAVTLALPT